MKNYGKNATDILNYEAICIVVFVFIQVMFYLT